MVSTKKHTKKLLDSWQKSREKGIKKYQARIKAEGKKKTAINNSNSTRSQLLVIYKIQIAILKPKHPVCDRCKKNKASDVHHMKGKQGFLLIMSKFFKYLCRDCHRWATDYSKEAIEMGLSLPRNSITEYEFTDLEVGLIKKYNIKTPKGVYI